MLVYLLKQRSKVLSLGSAELLNLVTNFEKLWLYLHVHRIVVEVFPSIVQITQRTTLFYEFYL